MARCTTLSSPYDRGLSRILIAFVLCGLFFLIVPGLGLGVANLFFITARHAPGNTGWTQAHGHAQLFGWLGSFILGVGFYAIPRLRQTPLSRFVAWTTLVFWGAGVALRVGTTLSAVQWRLFLPLSAALELIAVLLFVAACFLIPQRDTSSTNRMSLALIKLASFGFVMTLLLQLFLLLNLARNAQTPFLGPEENGQLLNMAMWGAIVPMIWGFAARWLPPTLGLRAPRPALLRFAGQLLAFGALASLMMPRVGMLMMLVASCLFITALRIFEAPAREAKLRGVHTSMPHFVRLSYAWLIVSSVAALYAVAAPEVAGLASAARHALAVGFMAASLFAIAPRFLPAFFGAPRLFSARLMFFSLLFLNIGCGIRVVSQVAAYGNLFAHAWFCLRFGALFDALAFATFVFNIAATLRLTRVTEMSETKAAA
jgi:hypothetical protein